jgi:Zn-dependent protease with chaperone function
MVLPRFTIKVLLIVTAIAAVLALVLRSAVKDSEPWAIAVCISLAGILGIFCLFILFWVAAWIWDQSLGQAFKPPTMQGGNPFASAGPPRQIIKPAEPQ